ncbi:hypothetical protein [Salinigranum halophilum]|nr:hypothetical protein [Salinigranum halophilum]
MSVGIGGDDETARNQRRQTRQYGSSLLLTTLSKRLGDDWD